MIISHKYKFIFIKTVKTAGTSIETYLSQHCGEDDILTPFGRAEAGHKPRNYQGEFDPSLEIALTQGEAAKTAREELQQRTKFYNHMPAYLVRCRVSEQIWKDYFKFCVERNPWDKVISHYYFMKGRWSLNMSLDEFIPNYPCLNYPRYTEYHDHDRVMVDRVLRYEKLNEELAHVFGLLHIPFAGALTIRAKGDYRSDRRPYQAILTDQQRRLIEQIYNREIQLHDYRY